MKFSRKFNNYLKTRIFISNLYFIKIISIILNIFILLKFKEIFKIIIEIFITELILLKKIIKY